MGSPAGCGSGERRDGKAAISNCDHFDYGMPRRSCAEPRKSPVSKLLPLIGMVVAGLVGIVFLADLAAGFPFGRVSIAADIGFLVSSLIVGYLSWSLIDRTGS